MTYDAFNPIAINNNLVTCFYNRYYSRAFTSHGLCIFKSQVSISLLGFFCPRFNLGLSFMAGDALLK